MRTIKLILILMLVLTTVIFGLDKGSRMLSGVDDGPSIICEEMLLEVSVDAEESVLLTGVTASDHQDGDLTNQILVAGVSKLLDENTAKVTYLVFDSDNNMARLERSIRYTDYRRPTIRLSEELRLASPNSGELLSRIRAIDVIDGDISESVRISALSNTDRSNVRRVTATVTNSMGDTAKVVLPVIIEETSNSRPVIGLSQHLIYMDAGVEFNPYYYISRVSVNDVTVNAQDVQVEGLPDTETPGTYYVTYTYSNGEETGLSILTVVIR